MSLCWTFFQIIFYHLLETLIFERFWGKFIFYIILIWVNTYTNLHRFSIFIRSNMLDCILFTKSFVLRKLFWQVTITHLVNHIIICCIWKCVGSKMYTLSYHFFIHARWTIFFFSYMLVFKFEQYFLEIYIVRNMIYHKN